MTSAQLLGFLPLNCFRASRIARAAAVAAEPEYTVPRHVKIGWESNSKLTTARHAVFQVPESIFAPVDTLDDFVVAFSKSLIEAISNPRNYLLTLRYAARWRNYSAETASLADDSVLTRFAFRDGR